MKANISKDLIIKASLAKQNELVENIQKRIDSMNSEALSHNYSGSQSEDRSAGTIEIVDALKSEHEFATNELKHLETLDPLSENSDVSPGAVVVTDQLVFFISISSEKIEIDGSEIISISTNAPIYVVMKGLKKGDTFKFNENKYEIKDVY